MRERIVDAAQELNDDANECVTSSIDRVYFTIPDCRYQSCCSTLRELNLPTSIDALERPIGLPPSLLKKAEAVRLEEGPDRIEESIENVERFAEHNSRLLDEVKRIHQYPQLSTSFPCPTSIGYGYP